MQSQERQENRQKDLSRLLGLTGVFQYSVFKIAIRTLKTTFCNVHIVLTVPQILLMIFLKKLCFWHQNGQKMAFFWLSLVFISSHVRKMTEEAHPNDLNTNQEWDIMRTGVRVYKCKP